MPQLMDWTADFTVHALMLTGVPVVREGLHFTIPSGSWSVVEACSGVRYLIASVVVGTLYAYLSYRSWRRRLGFVVISFIVPIVANWLRAYMIVMIGHLSNNKLAVGVDHLIYGWVFFGVVMLLMFMIGARWAEHRDTDQNPSGDAVAPGTPQSKYGVWVAAALVAVIAVIPHVWLTVLERNEAKSASVPPALTLAAPTGWQAAEARAIGWRPEYANARAEAQQEFVRDGRRVGVFMAYYRQQDYGHKLITSENALVKTTNRDWIRAASGKRTIALGERQVEARTAELRGASGQRLVAWQWYWIGGRLTTSDHVAKAWQAINRLLGRGDDSTVVVVYAPVDAAGDGEASLESFVRTMGDRLDTALPVRR